MAESSQSNRQTWLTLLDRLAKTASGRREASDPDKSGYNELEDLREAERQAYHRYQMARNG